MLFRSTSTNAPQKTNNCHLHSLTNGTMMFYECISLSEFTSDLSSLSNGDSMFKNCSNLASFTSDLSSLTIGKSMFSYCPNLFEFASDLSSLTNGSNMFYGCTKLSVFKSDLSSLTNGKSMFSGYGLNSEIFKNNLTSFTSDLSSLTNGDSMFQFCENLTTFTSDLSSLIYGYYMFRQCSNLTTFTSDLSSLTYGERMFQETKLTPQSVMYIADSIKDIVAVKKLYQDGIIPYVTKTNGKYSAHKGFMSDGKYVYTYHDPKPTTATISASNIGKLTIGINVANDAATIEDQLQAFAEDATYDSWSDIKQAFVNKGWTVTWQYGGTSTSITYDMRGERAIPCPVYAQLEEVEDKDHAEYTNEEGTKFYNINWGHDVTNYDDFQQFNSLEDAMVAFGVILKQTEEETV